MSELGATLIFRHATLAALVATYKANGHDAKAAILAHSDELEADYLAHQARVHPGAPPIDWKALLAALMPILIALLQSLAGG